MKLAPLLILTMTLPGSVLAAEKGPFKGMTEITFDTAPIRGRSEVIQRRAASDDAEHSTQQSQAPENPDFEAIFSNGRSGAAGSAAGSIDKKRPKREDLKEKKARKSKKRAPPRQPADESATPKSSKDPAAAPASPAKGTVNP